MGIERPEKAHASQIEEPLIRDPVQAASPAVVGTSTVLVRPLDSESIGMTYRSRSNANKSSQKGWVYRAVTQYRRAPPRVRQGRLEQTGSQPPGATTEFEDRGRHVEMALSYGSAEMRAEA